MKATFTKTPKKKLTLTVKAKPTMTLKKRG